VVVDVYQIWRAERTNSAQWALHHIINAESYQVTQKHNQQQTTKTPQKQQTKPTIFSEITQNIPVV